MADTIDGGAYQDAQRHWVNAEGKPLTKAQIAEAEQLAAEREALRAEQEKQARLLDAQRDPTARAIAAALQPAAAAPRPSASAAPEPTAKEGKA